MSNYVRCLDCGQMVYEMARICPFCGGHPPTYRNNMDAFFNGPPYVVGGGGIGFTIGGVLFCLLDVHFFKAMILTVVIGVIATVVLQNCSYRTQQIVALLSWLPTGLLMGGILLYVGLAVLWALWTA